MLLNLLHLLMVQVDIKL